jgi:MFS family permease
MGLDAQAIAGIFFVTKMFDVVTDPIFGIVSDRYETPWGRRRPWLVVGTVILVLGSRRSAIRPGHWNSRPTTTSEQTLPGGCRWQQ